MFLNEKIGIFYICSIRFAIEVLVYHLRRNIVILIIIILGPETNFFFTLEGNLHRGLGSRAFRITPTQWCGIGCPHVRPPPGLINLEFGRVLLPILL